MSLYSQWTQIAQAERDPASHKEFWNTYFAAETENYKKLLADHDKVYAGTLKSLAETFDMDPVTFAGFLDGINTSLKAELDLESLTEDTELSLNIDFEKLYYNMLDAKAEWLYTLPQWDGILTEERRREITKEFRAAKVFVNETVIGRNDPCPCGSGKKYKKCCGKQADRDAE